MQTQAQVSHLLDKHESIAKSGQILWKLQRTDFFSEIASVVLLLTTRKTVNVTGNSEVEAGTFGLFKVFPV